MVDMRVWSRVAGPALLVVALTGACRTTAQFAPSVPAEAGFRVEGGVLKVWTGTPCNGVFRERLTFDVGTHESTDVEWGAPRPGVLFERMDLLKITGEPVTEPRVDLHLEQPPPTGYDWTKAEALNFAVDGPSAWGSRVDVARVLRESPQHPAGSYLFGAIGWKDPADVGRENGRSFITICTPDPAREKGTGTAG